MNAGASAEQPILDVKGLDAGYGALQILFGVGLDVCEGEHVLVFGPNGAGKSTLIKTLAGLIRPAAGRIRTRDRDITGLAAEDVARAGIGYVPQIDNVFASMTVAENLEIGAILAGREGKRRIDEMYALFPILAERRRQDAGTLSGGERQMLAVARALIPRPALLLLDEPSAGVAPKMVESIFQTVAGLRQTGTAVLMIEQNARQALHHVDRGYVLESGRVRFEDDADALLDNDEIAALYLGGGGTD